MEVDRTVGHSLAHPKSAAGVLLRAPGLGAARHPTNVLHLLYFIILFYFLAFCFTFRIMQHLRSPQPPSTALAFLILNS